MKRAIVDLSSVIWTGLLAGKDDEFGRKYPNEAGKEVFVNSASHGYENAMGYLLNVMDEIKVQPHQMIFVMEGKNSKAVRLHLHPGYKAGRERIPQQYEEFNKCKEQVLQAFLNVGANVCWQDHGVEADDVIGFLATKLKGEKYIISNDKDLAQLVDPAFGIHQMRTGSLDKNPFGDFPHRYIPVYIALVGDSGDKIPGARGFGEVAFNKLLGVFGEGALPAIEGLIQQKQLIDLQEDVPELKDLLKVIDDAENVYLSYELGRLHIEKVDTVRRPLQWRAGMVKPRSVIEDERLKPFGGVVRLVSDEKYEEAVKWAREQLRLSPFVALDIETSTPAESDDWIERLGKSEDRVPVDVFGSDLTSLQLTFGPNLQYTLYLPVDNVPEEGVSNLSIEQVRDFVDLIPREKHIVIQNCAFELPVCFNAWGQDWRDDPEWHGFLRNAIDTKIMSSYVDENRSAGLKQNSKLLLGYEQASYDSVTTKTYLATQWTPEVMGGKLIGSDGENGTFTVRHKMNELTAREVLNYGADDTICTAALAVHFRTIMEIEGSWDVFLEVEQLPAYVTAQAFVDGVDFSLETMREMEKDDDVAYDKAWAVLREYLIKIGFEGTQCPVYTELTPAAIKEAVQIVLGQELKTMVRTPKKLAKLIRQQWETDESGDRAALLATFIEDENLAVFNELVAKHYAGEPKLDLASPKQMAALLYDRMGLPIHVVNDVTPLEKQHQPELDQAMRRFKQYRLGKVESLNAEEWALVRKKAKANDDAIDFALAFDQEFVDDEVRAALKAIGVMKKVMTRRSLFYANYWNMVHWKDGKIHSQMNQCAAVTRRYSSSNPNLQQLPKKGEGMRFRSCFRPHRSDAVIVSIDFTGQELRLAAYDSQDANMLACYIGDNLKDLHSITAAGAMKLKWGVQAVKDAFATYGPDLPQNADGQYTLFRDRIHKALEHDDPMWKKADDLRKDSKNVNFAAQFGGQAAKLSETLIMTVADAQLFLDARSAMFPGVLEAAKRAEDDCKKKGYATTLLGVRRHLREAIMSDDAQVVSRAARQAWNMRIQGSAAEMTKAAMAKLWRSGALHRLDVRFIAPIHDELVASVRRDHTLEFTRVMHECMTAPYAGMNVPILGSISLGPDFADQHECGDYFIPERIQEALNKVFPAANDASLEVREAA